jgi:2-desacetyl-2-hydroxyethyl bacteriochlorophyllide A dehydrogenase
MKYIVCNKPRDLEIKDKDIPIRKEGEALLKVNKVGICGTDLHAYEGNQAFFTYPRILGHELATTVLEIDENPQGIVVNDKVVVMPYVSCGKCIACGNGKTNCCSNISVLGVHGDGGMQEQITVPTNLLLKTKNLSYDQMTIVEPLAIGAHAISRALVKKGEFVAVIGCGPIGIGAMKIAQIAGAKVIALDVNKERLKYVNEQIGVKFIVDAGSNPVEKITEITGGDMTNVVIDASGNKHAIEAGIDYMAHGGRYVLVGLSNGELTFSHPEIHSKETTLMCSRNATIEDFKHVIKILNQFPTDSFITHNVNHTEVVEQFDSWLNPKNGVIKVTVDF